STPSSRAAPIQTRETRRISPSRCCRGLKHLIQPPPPDKSPTALLVAVGRPQAHVNFPARAAQIVSTLLKKGADVNAEQADGYTPLTLLFSPHSGYNAGDLSRL